MQIVRCRVGHLLQFKVGTFQFRRPQFPLGDINMDTNDTDRLAVLIPLGLAARENPDVGPILAAKTER